MVPGNTQILLSFYLLGMTGFGLCANGDSDRCPALLDVNQRQTIEGYVRARYEIPDAIGLTLTGVTTVGDTCYRELTIQGKTPTRTWELKLFASPDLRFLSSDLLDTTIDPAAEQRRTREALMMGLTDGASAARGPKKATVTIVEFSDFQCPYCRKFASMLDGVLADESHDLRVVFHHMPLGGHDWARTAAEGAGCAQLQSSEAFWKLHDQIFREQTTITVGNVRAKLVDMAAGIDALDPKAFQKCLDEGLSVGLVLKDVNLAESNQVNGTPTFFINGRRVEGVENASKLRELIVTARERARTYSSAIRTKASQAAVH